MSLLFRLSTLALLATITLVGGRVRAEDEGQDDLDRATAAKVSARSEADLDEVIRLCESALKKGLDEQNSKFAKTLLGATLVQRGSVRAGALVTRLADGPDVAESVKAALGDLEKGVELTGDHPQALYQIARLNLLPGGDRKRAAEALDQTIELLEDEPLLKAKALTLRAGITKDPEQRMADLDEAARLAPQDAGLLRTRALTNILQRKLAEALVDLEKAVELEPENPQSHELMASVLAMLRRFDEALASLDKARKLRPDAIGLLLQKARIHAAQPDLDAALAALDEAAELEPNNADPHVLKATVLAMQKEYDRAHASLDKARKLRPDAAALLVQKARIHAAQKKLDAALADLTEACRIEPENVLILLTRAGLYQQLDQSDEALADVDRALKLKPGLSPAVRLRALLLTAAEKFDEAIAELQAHRQREPKDLVALAQLAMLYASRERHKEAAEIYTAILDERPEHWGSLRGRGDALLSSGKHREAIADYEAALKQQPKDPHLLNNFAWLLATSPADKLRDGKRAVRMAAEASELTEHKQAHILSTLAAAYAEVGDFTQAVKWAEKAIEVGGEDRVDDLKDELESFRAGKPWREDLSQDPPKDEQP
ncbi:MAG: tetratricopeptide repeat protein [Candidatus Nealsonbacteria bacterium]|nr:tetratricopeptide repeat protein [Candidatus Nealsonbacteria bacterium]